MSNNLIIAEFLANKDKKAYGPLYWLAANILEMRELRSMSQSDVGKAIGASRTWLSQVESADNRKLTYLELAAIAKALNCELRITLIPRPNADQVTNSSAPLPQD